MKINIVVANNLCLPKKGTDGAAGYDVAYHGSKSICIEPQTMVSVPTGVYMELPLGYECQVRPRSGLMFNNDIVGMLGTIDSDYRGEVKVLLFNSGQKAFTIHPYDRIGQFVFAKHESPEIEISEELSTTNRGENGFGSTGI